MSETARLAAIDRHDAARDRDYTWWVATFMPGPTALVLLAAVLYALTGEWLLSPLGFGVLWAFWAIEGVVVVERRAARRGHVHIYQQHARPLRCLDCHRAVLPWRVRLWNWATTHILICTHIAIWQADRRHARSRETS